MTKICNREFDFQAAQRLVNEGFLPPVARALAARGIGSSDDMLQEWSGMLSPDSLEGTHEAACRLADAIINKEHVTVVADYDCDGATACAVALRGLRMLGLQCDYFVPDRVIHGYGLTPVVVDLVAARTPRPSLIITVDNGVSSVAAVAHARLLNIDVIVTDHHLPGTELPAANAIVNPNLCSCTFASKNLAGVGVMFYVLLALRAELRRRNHFDQMSQPRLDTLVDLVALGTVADVVRLDKNNRILVAQGLKRIRSGRMHAGLAALFSVAGKDTLNASVRDFGFALGPRINAAGRIGSMQDGIECLLADDPITALERAQGLNAINNDRRELEGEMQQIAEATLCGLDLSTRASVTLFNETFNEGVVGLIASRIRERIHRPIIAFAPTESGMLKGSGRSIPGIHLRDMLDLVNKRAPGIIERFGGHAMAAGLTLLADSIDIFSKTFEEVVRENADENTFERIVLTDGGLAPDEITEQLITSIDQQIWGQGFEAPLFVNEFQVIHQRLLKDAHSKLTLQLGGSRFDAIFFRYTDTLPATARLAYRPAINEYRGHRSIQLVIEDIDV